MHDFHPEKWEDREMQNDLAALVSRTDRLMHRYHRVHREPTEQGIDPRRGQGRILALLQKTGEISQKELSFLLDLRQQSLSELLRKLETAGYLTRETNPDDRRVARIVLTDQGREAKVTGDDLSGAFACLSDDERTNLASYLTRVCEHMEGDLREAGDMPESCFGRRPFDHMPPPPPGMPGEHHRPMPHFGHGSGTFGRPPMPPLPHGERPPMPGGDHPPMRPPVPPRHGFRPDDDEED